MYVLTYVHMNKWMNGQTERQKLYTLDILCMLGYEKANLIYQWLFDIIFGTGQAYNLERQSDPGISIDLDSSLASMDTLEFCLVRENSKSALFVFKLWKCMSSTWKNLLQPTKTHTSLQIQEVCLEPFSVASKGTKGSWKGQLGLMRQQIHRLIRVFTGYASGAFVML